MERAGWARTTHDWSLAVDRAHLAAVQEQFATLAPGGVLHLLHEVLAYVADEADALGLVGARCDVALLPHGCVSVRDYGRGTDTRRDGTPTPIRKPIMATRDLRFFDHPNAQVLPDGWPRRGMSVVAALSEWLLHENRRHDGGWLQRYERGVPVTELVELQADGTTGTQVRFLPDQRLTRVDKECLDAVLLRSWPRLAITVSDRQ